MSTIVIGTRGSKLALWQAEYVKSLLEKNSLKAEIKVIETTGDKILNVALSKIGSKGVFTQELEEALRTGDIHIACHSAKDVPSTLPEDLPLLTFTDRENAEDVLVSYDKSISLDQPITVGTSSTRRVALLKHYYPHLNIVDMRGNLQTRFQKMKDGVCDAMILAFAGVYRMNLNQYIAQVLDIKKLVPPVGQGCVALQSHVDLDECVKLKIVDSVESFETKTRLLAERAFLKKLEGGCSIPSFCNATLLEGKINIRGGLVSLDGTQHVQYELVQGFKQSPEELGTELAEKILASGGDKILAQIKKDLNK